MIRSAGVDIGTNTALLLIADIENGDIVNVVCDELMFPRLGEGLNATGVIAEGAIQRAESELEKFRQRIQSSRVDVVRAAATSALRTSTNGIQTRDRLSASLGSPIEIIDGQTEAALTYQGVAKGYDANVRVIDIGGGSTEISYGRSATYHNSVSIEIGCVRLHEQFLQDELSDATLAAAKKMVRNAIVGTLQSAPYLYQNLSSEQPSVTIGVSGTPTGIVMIDKGLKSFDDSQIHNQKITVDAIENVVQKCIEARKIDAKTLHGVPQQRLDILPAGCVILLEYMQLAAVESILVSTRGLRHGLALSAQSKNT